MRKSIRSFNENMLCFLYGLFFPHISSLNLEVLPNELLLEILSYVSITDLYYGWLNLNCRFNGIVHTLPLTKFYTEPKQSDEEPLRYFAFQLVSLETDKDLSSSIVNKINLVDYPNLRILKLHDPTPTQVDIIRQDNFPHLEYLSLIETSNFNFENLCQLKSLRSCEVNSLEIDDQCSYSSSSIRSLTLHNYDPSNLVHLLRHLPELTFLKMNIFWTSTLLNKFDSTTVFIHPNLKSLDLSMINLEFYKNDTNVDISEAVSSLLAYVSPYKRVRCHLNLFSISDFNFEQLQRTVTTLNFFRFSCHLIYFIKYTPPPDIDRIRQLPLFNRLKPKPKFIVPDVVVTYDSTWTNTNHHFVR
jgi:hypothetical protein